MLKKTNNNYINYLEKPILIDTEEKQEGKEKINFEKIKKKFDLLKISDIEIYGQIPTCNNCELEKKEIQGLIAGFIFLILLEIFVPIKSKNKLDAYSTFLFDIYLYLIYYQLEHFCLYNIGDKKR